MGLTLDTNPELTDKLAYQPAEVGSLEAAVSEARQRRAELIAQKRREHSARLSYDTVKSERLPSVGGKRDARRWEAEVEAGRGGLLLAEQELALARRRYQAAVTNSIEVTGAQTGLDRAQSNQIGALYDYNVARIDLATATGRIRECLNQ